MKIEVFKTKLSMLGLSERFSYTRPTLFVFVELSVRTRIS